MIGWAWSGRGVLTLPRCDGRKYTVSNISRRAGVAADRSDICEVPLTEHMHPYPTLVYVLEGAIDVEVDRGTPRSYTAGDSFLMVVDTWTNAKNNRTIPAKVLVVYVGVRGKPNLVRPQ